MPARNQFEDIDALLSTVGGDAAPTRRRSVVGSTAVVAISPLVHAPRHPERDGVAAPSV